MNEVGINSEASFSASCIFFSILEGTARDGSCVFLICSLFDYLPSRGKRVKCIEIACDARRGLWSLLCIAHEHQTFTEFVPDRLLVDFKVSSSVFTMWAIEASKFSVVHAFMLKSIAA